MNPAVRRETRGLGHSFKGVCLYVLNPEREAVAEAIDANRPIPHRGGFVVGRNLTSDDPEMAWRLMASTAYRAESLKLAAGLKATGRKTEKPVFHYTLAWHPDEKPTEKEMVEAADSSLKALGLEEHEALIVQHRDKAHAHLHVIANRIHPVTGRTNPLSNNLHKLDRWAAEYERAQGRIVSPDRERKHRALERGEAPPADRKRWLTHEEWTSRRHTKSERRDHLLTDARVKARGLNQDIRAAFRPAWSLLGKRQYKQRRDLARAVARRDRASIAHFINQNRPTLLKAYATYDEARAGWPSLLRPADLKEAVKRGQEAERRALGQQQQQVRQLRQTKHWSAYRAHRDATRAQDTAARMPTTTPPPMAAPAPAPARPVTRPDRAAAERYRALTEGRAVPPPLDQLRKHLPLADPADDYERRKAEALKDIVERQKAAKERQRQRDVARGRDRDRDRDPER